MGFVFSMILGFVLGVLFYITDRKRGPKWYKSWYDLTHKDPLEALPPHGLVFRRHTKAKITWAIVLGIIVFVILLPFDGSPLTALIDGIGVLAGLVVAFFVTPLFFKIDQQKVDAVLSKLDETQDQPKTVVPAKEAPPVPTAVELEKEEMEEQAQDKSASDQASDKSNPDETSEDKPSSTNASEDKDWRGGVKKFLDS